MKGHLDSTGMLKASIQVINDGITNHSVNFDLQISEEERGWEFQDVTAETLKHFSNLDAESIQLEAFTAPPLFCIAAYLRLYDEIHNGNKDWRVVFNLLRFTKYSVSSFHADVVTIALLSTLKAEEIYSLGLRDLYML